VNPSLSERNCVLLKRSSSAFVTGVRATVYKAGSSQLTRMHVTGETIWTWLRNVTKKRMSHVRFETATPWGGECC